MGLDFTAYRKIARVEDCDNKDNDSCDERGHLYYFALVGFEERLDGMPRGCYKTEGAMDPRASRSYSGYSIWRNTLAWFALDMSAQSVWDKKDELKGKPFYELIDFADNEGCIGPVTSAKLAKDFKEHHEKAAEFMRTGIPKLLERLRQSDEAVEQDERSFMQTYDGLALAFAHAAGEGCVQLH